MQAEGLIFKVQRQNITNILLL